MPTLGLFIALDAQQVGELKKQPPEERLDFLRSALDLKLWVARRDLAQEADEAWNPIHRALTDGTLSHTNGPLGQAILGGESLCDGQDYVLNLKSPEQVREITDALAQVTHEQLRSGYDRINPDNYGRQLSDDDFAYTWAWFQEIRAFYRKSAAENFWIVFSMGG